MNIIYSRNLTYLNPIKLNKDGKTIGFPVIYKHKYYYLSCREYNEETSHFFRNFSGFGIQKSILKKIIQGDEPPFDKMVGIIIYYKGVNERRYFYADLDTWLMESEDYDTTKVKSGVIEAYGYQKILNMRFMKILGYHPDDYKVKEELINPTVNLSGNI